MKKEEKDALAGCLVWIVILAIILFPLACWTDSNLDFWISQLKEEPVDVHFAFSIIISVFAPTTILANAIASVFRYACEHDYRDGPPPTDLQES